MRERGRIGVQYWPDAMLAILVKLADFRGES
jgi:hypothetical protein